MKNYTDLNIILDRSGSMMSIAKDMVGGINTFIEKERETGDETKISLFQFDDKYDTVFVDKDINDDFDITLTPRGMTALYDAIGKTVVSVGEKLDSMKEDDKPNRVLFVIVTDGFENCSQEYYATAVKDKIKHQRDVYAWDFIFLGAGENDVLNQHKGVGIERTSSLGFAADSASVQNAWLNVSEGYQFYKSLDRENVNTRSATFTFNNLVDAVQKEEDAKFLDAVDKVVTKS